MAACAAPLRAANIVRTAEIVAIFLFIAAPLSLSLSTIYSDPPDCK